MNIAVKLASKQILFLKRYVLSKSNIASEFKDDNLSIIGVTLNQEVGQSWGIYLQPCSNYILLVLINLKVVEVRAPGHPL